MSSSPHVRDVRDSDFDEQVIARSHQVPVVVDFWAEWCGPCRALSPVIEKAVADLDGRVVLAKIDTDAAPEVAARYRISSIPTVMAFRGGVPVDTFVGARPAAAVRQFLEQVAPSLERQALAQAHEARATGDLTGAMTLLRPLTIAVDSEVAGSAALLLGRVALDAGRPEEAEAALAAVDARHPDWPAAEALRQVVALHSDATAYGGAEKARAALEANPDDLEARFALAAALATAGKTTDALDHLLLIVSRSRKFRDDLARRTVVALLEHLGPDSEMAREYRRKLQVIL